MAESSTVSAGVNATADQYNKVRTDAIKHLVRFVFFIKGGVVVQNDASAKYIIPANMTVVEIKHVIGSGTSATFRVRKNGATDIDSGIVSTTTVATDSSPSTPELVEDDILQLDVTGISGSPQDLIVIVHATETK